jgi:hypothetical protein
MIRGFSAGIALGLIFAIAIIAIYPSNSDYALQNPYWNGMSELNRLMHPIQLTNLSIIYSTEPAGNFALLVIGPTLPYSQSEIESISNFVNRGGLLLIADDFGSANQLLQGLGINLRLSGVLLLDPLYNVKAPQLPLITNVTGVKDIAFNYGTYLNYTSQSEQKYPVTFFAYSSPFSFGDLKQSGNYVQGDPLGPLPVAASIKYGNGVVIIVSDSSLFLNSMINYANNYQFLQKIIADRQVIIDTSHWLYSYQSEASSIILSAYDFIQNSGLKYGFAALLLLSIYILNFKVKKEDGDIRKVIMNHPDWEIKDFEKLYQERKRYHNSGDKGKL